MAYFEGNIAEFTRYIGSYCRIKVMHITTKYRKQKGSCEECNSADKQLEAAHVRGKERPLIISNILSEYIQDGIIRVDLDEFSERFVDAHFPLEQFIRILCKDCHRAYDRTKPVSDDLPSPENALDEIKINEFDKKEAELIEKSIRNTLNKSDAIQLTNKHAGTNLNNANTLFSNINAAVDVWWLEPHNERFKSGFDFLLNYPDTKTLFYFHMKPGIITNPTGTFYQRGDSDYSKIFIPKSAIKFIDKKGFDFGKYLVREIKY
jgi:hypothetical protein